MNLKNSLTLIMNSALEAAKPKGKFKSLPKKPKGKLIVLGAGKAGASMAQEFENTYDGPLEGLVVTRYGHYTKTKFIKIIEASHPEPDKNGLIASKKIFELATKSSKDDHVVFLISGGASSLLTFPAKGVVFKEKQRINKELLRCGAPIDEMNIVRRSLSKIKGGRLAQAILPAKLTTYMISDIPRDDPAYIGSGPTIQATGLNEDSIKIQSLFFLLFIGLGYYFDITKNEWIIHIILIGFILSVEALNTVAEKICDIINPKYDSRIKLIKDISAGAVSFAVISSLIVLVIIYCPYFSDLLNNT